MQRCFICVAMCFLVGLVLSGCSPNGETSSDREEQEVKVPPKGEKQVRAVLMINIQHAPDLSPGAKVGKISFQQETDDGWPFAAEIVGAGGKPAAKATGLWKPGDEYPVTCRIEMSTE